MSQVGLFSGNRMVDGNHCILIRNSSKSMENTHKSIFRKIISTRIKVIHKDIGEDYNFNSSEVKNCLHIEDSISNLPIQDW